MPVSISTEKCGHVRGSVGGSVEEIPRLQRHGRIGHVDVVAGLHGADIGK